MKSFTQITFALALTVGTTAALAGDAKAPAAGGAKEAAKAPEMMKAPQELTDMAKMMTGTWKCDGKMAMDPNKPTEMQPAKMTMKMKSDLNGWWIVGNMDSPMFKGVMYTTYDPTAKKYYSMMVDSMGGSETTWSAGAKDNKMVWEGDMRSPMPGMTAAKTRETHDMSDMKAGLKLTGEMSMDGGKTWMKGWEATCKK